MTRVKNIDEFIERSNELLKARPRSTLITTTYSHRKVNHSSADTANATSRPATLYVKTYDPKSGACYRLRISKANQLSRVMTALGPRGVSITKNDKQKNVKGLASSQANIDVEYTEQTVDQQPTPEAETAQQPQETAGSSSGGKKKKNKKK